MKKLLILLLLLLIGCSLSNTPTSKIEELLNKYQSLNKEIEIDTNIINNNREYENEIKEIIKKQYKNMSYEIKDEEIDGKTATVVVEIEVYNYKDILDREAETNKIIKELKETKNKITYTIEFKLFKEKDNWIIEELTDEQNNKLLGIF
ncbi:MAG: hypothetical protein IJI49_05680 [Bacilli bacterium]|nr:hypothetical protein [Bacilli bacterium]